MGDRMIHKAAGIVPPGGTHVLIDFYGAQRLDDIQHIHRACIEAGEATGATILEGKFHHFGEGCGVSGVLLLAESHISIHTWPENGIATIDIYVCGACDAMKALPILKDALQAERATVIKVPRGDEIVGHVLESVTNKMAVIREIE